MAGRRTAIPFKELALKVVGPLEAYLVARAQRLDMTTNLPSTNIDELGNPLHAGVTTDIPEVSATFQAFDVSIKLFAVLTGTSRTSYPGAGVDISELQDIDVIGLVKDAVLASYVKSVHLRKCRVESFTFTYSVDGESTEEYTVAGSKKRWFKNDIVVDVFTGTPGSPQTLDQTPLVLKSGDYAMSVIADREYWTEGDDSVSGEYEINAGTKALTYADAPVTIVVVYHVSPPASVDWANISDDTIPAAIRGKDIVPVITATAGGETDLERVQSVTIRGTFPVERVEEMGNRDAVGYVTQVPEITGDLTVLDSDTALIDLFATGSFSSGDNEFDICEFTASGIELRIELLDPREGCFVGSRTILKTVRVPGITVTSEGHTTNVGGNATQTFAWKSTTGACLVYSGEYTP